MHTTVPFPPPTPTNPQSFALSLATLFGGEKIVVTTKKEKEVILEEAPGAQELIERLIAAGVKIGFGFNVTKGSAYRDLPTPEDKFDAVVVNYPVAVEYGKDCADAEENQRYVRKVMKHCPDVLSQKGCVYVAQVDGLGYVEWQTSRLALLADTGLRLVNKFPFRTAEYPDYTPKYASFDGAAQFKNSTCFVFGRKKRYDAFDKQEEREIEFMRLKERRQKKREGSDSSDDDATQKKKDRKEKKEKKERRNRRHSTDGSEDARLIEDKPSGGDRDRDRDRDYRRDDRDRDYGRGDRDRRERDYDRRDRDRRDRDYDRRRR